MHRLKNRNKICAGEILLREKEKKRMTLITEVEQFFLSSLLRYILTLLDVLVLPAYSEKHRQLMRVQREREREREREEREDSRREKQ